MSENNFKKLIKIAELSCYQSSSLNLTDFKNELYCKLFFDGIMCWPNTKAGEVAIQPCNNELIKTKTSNVFATNQCTENGTWYIPENSTNPSANYTDCGYMYLEDTLCVTPISNADVLKQTLYDDWLPLIKNISYLGYAISIASALACLLIFITIKRLHCARNTLHIHLFISFLMRAIMFLLKDALFIKGTALSHETDYVDGEPMFKKAHYSWVCKAIISLRNYFIISNFTFILMEGLYLHNLMFLNLFSYKNGVAIYYLLGWGIPILFVIPWMTLKIFTEDVFCWTQKDNIFIDLLIDLPIGCTVAINFILFLIIIKVLFVKINSICIQQRKKKYRKLLKSTLILIPLFGIPYSISLILSFYVKQSQILELIWLMFDQTFSAFQGLFASLVYCILNGDVQTEIKRKYSSIKDRNNKEFRRSRTISQTQQFSLQANDEVNLQENLNFGLKENTKKITEGYF